LSLIIGRLLFLFANRRAGEPELCCNFLSFTQAISYVENFPKAQGDAASAGSGLASPNEKPNPNVDADATFVLAQDDAKDFAFIARPRRDQDWESYGSFRSVSLPTVSNRHDVSPDGHDGATCSPRAARRARLLQSRG
jgi:hypothetical protein